MKPKYLLLCSIVVIALSVWLSGVYRHLRSPQGTVYVKKELITGFSGYTLYSGRFSATLKQPARLPSGYLKLTILYPDSDAVTGVTYLKEINGAAFPRLTFSREDLFSVERDNGGPLIYKERNGLPQLQQVFDSLLPLWGKPGRIQLRCYSYIPSADWFGDLNADYAYWAFFNGEIEGHSHRYIQLTRFVAIQLRDEGLLSPDDEFYSDNDNPNGNFSRVYYEDWTDLMTSLK